jgi:hypothetical protein
LDLLGGFFSDNVDNGVSTIVQFYRRGQYVAKTPTKNNIYRLAYSYMVGVRWINGIPLTG